MCHPRGSRRVALTGLSPLPAEGSEPGWTTVTVDMSAAAHRFGAGRRVRLQISGGAHPRFARNPGTGDPLATSTRLAPVDIEIAHDPGQPGALTLPVIDIEDPAAGG